MGKTLKPGQRCTNSARCCSAGHYFHKPFDKLPLAVGEAPRCEFVQPAPAKPFLETLRATACPDGHGGRNGCISQGLAADIEQAGYFCAARIRLAVQPTKEKK